MYNYIDKMPEDIRREASGLIDDELNKVDLPSFDEVFALSNLYDIGRECCNGLRWKPSISRFETKRVSQLGFVIKQIESGVYRQSAFNQFGLNERGKTRNIAALKPQDRTVQKLMNREVLLKVVAPQLVDNNSASIEGKGIDFAINTFKDQLRNHYDKYGLEGGIYQFDFSKFFESIPHELIKNNIIRPIGLEEKLETTLLNFVNDFRRLKGAKERKDEFGWRGVGLGSEVSQTIALDAATYLDKYIVIVLKKDASGRYMDDGYVISNDLEELEYIQQRSHELTDAFGMKLNPKKDIITPFKSQKYFVFLKNRYMITETGRIVMKPVKSNLKVINKRFKKWRAKLDEGKMTIEDVCNSYNGWRASILRCNDVYETVYNKDLMFVEMFRDELRYFHRPFKCFIKCIKTKEGTYEYITKKLKKSKKNNIKQLNIEYN